MSTNSNSYCVHEFALIDVKHDNHEAKIKAVEVLGGGVLRILEDKGGSASFGDCVDAMIDDVASDETRAALILYHTRDAGMISIDTTTSEVTPIAS
ncbi:MAG: hypothetical protein U0491_00025 [Candidatus Saccharimonadales bacterium]